MDDQTFDQQTALDWINSIEKAGKSLRDEDIYPILNSWIRDVSPTKVLDIGCGQGICSAKLVLNNRCYTGVEPSGFLLDRAKQLYSCESKTFLLGSAYQLPLPDASFDAAFSVLVWHLLEDIHTAAQELSRVLKNDGTFLIISANPGGYDAWKGLYSNLQFNGKRLEGTMQLGAAASQDVLYLHTDDEIRGALQEAGLLVTQTETFRPSTKFEGQKMLVSIQGNKALP